MLSNLVNPEVMGQMISANLPKKIKFSKIAKIDRTLVARAGNTITVPKYAYIGDAEDVAEGVAMGTTVLTASTTTATVKKAGKAVEITDEALLSGYGDPAGEANNQLLVSIASKVDNDSLEALLGATLVKDLSSEAISYDGIVDAVDLLDDENDVAVTKTMFVSPKQVTQIRKLADFKDINKYPLQTMMTGVIGEIAGCQIVPSKKIVAVDGVYACPIVVTATIDPNQASDADGNAEEAPAITIYLKRDVEVEADRDILKKTTVASADEHFVAVLSNDSKVVVAKFKA
jgi:N4-gp56 family major capsid protein